MAAAGDTTDDQSRTASRQGGEVATAPRRRGRLSNGKRSFVLGGHRVVAGGHALRQGPGHRPVHLRCGPGRRAGSEAFQESAGGSGHDTHRSAVQRGHRVIKGFDVSRGAVITQTGGVDIGQQGRLRIGCRTHPQRRRRRRRTAAGHRHRDDENQQPAQRRRPHRGSLTPRRQRPPQPPPRDRPADPVGWVRCGQPQDHRRRRRRSPLQQRLSSFR